MIRSPLYGLLAAIFLSACVAPGNDDSELSKAAGKASCAEGEELVIAEWSSTAPTDVGGAQGIGDEYALSLPGGCQYDQLEVTIQWDLAVEDLDLDVLDASGTVVGSSGAFNAIENGAVETAQISLPAGDYTVFTKSYANVETPYNGTATLKCLTPGGCGAGAGSDAVAGPSVAAVSECQAAYAGIEVGAAAAVVDPDLAWNQTGRLILSFDNAASRASAFARLQKTQTLEAASIAGAYELKNLQMVVLPEAHLTPALIADLRNVLDGTALISFWGQHDQQPFLNSSVPLIGVDDARRAFATPELPLTGKGIGVGIVDSGWDQTQGDFDNIEKTINVRMFANVPVAMDNTETNGGHGNHVLGTVVGDGTQSGGSVVGVAPGVDMMSTAIDVGFPYVFTIEGIDYILERQEELNIRVTNHSYGVSATGQRFNPTSAGALASKRLYDADIIAVFAAGNDGPDPDTADAGSQHPCVIGVAAGDRQFQLTGFSSRGTPDGANSGPDITAPGQAITAARAINGFAHTTQPNLSNPRYATISGTSMAAPHVAGVVALMLEANPNLNFESVMQILAETARPMIRTDGTPYEEFEVGFGYIDALGAVAAALGQPRPTTAQTVPPGPGVTKVATYEGNTGTTTPVVCLGCANGEAGFARHRFVYELPAGVYQQAEFVLHLATEIESVSFEVFDPSGASIGSTGFDSNALADPADDQISPTGLAGTSTHRLSLDAPQAGAYTIEIRTNVGVAEKFFADVNISCSDTGCS